MDQVSLNHVSMLPALKTKFSLRAAPSSFAVFVGIFAAFFAAGVSAQSTFISFTGATYTQNFNTLPSSGTFPFSGSGPFDLPTTTPGSLNGWGFGRLAGSSPNASFLFDDGTNTTASAYSYGSTGATERALGSISTGSTLNTAFGALLVNNSGATINSITLTFTGEQWHRGGNSQSLDFGYGVGATSVLAGTFTPFSALNFGNVQNGSSAPLDGNLPANQLLISATITGLNWTNGSNLVIRWTNTGNAAQPAGLAIDNFSFAIPEPGTVALMAFGLGLLGLGIRRRLA